jgi:hypothetical protein
MCATLSRGTGGAVDYLNIVENGVDFVPNMARIQTASSHGGRMNNENEQVIANWRILPLFLVGMDPGHARRPTSVMGATIFVAKITIVCFMGQMTTVGIFFGYSGWLILNLAKLKHGLLVLRLESWHRPGVGTEGWTLKSNACDPHNVVSRHLAGPKLHCRRESA